MAERWHAEPIDAWLHRSLAGSYGMVVDEAVPEDLVALADCVGRR